MQRALLRYLAAEQAQSDANRTPLLSRTQISTATGFQKNSIDKTIRRLISAGLLRRNEFSHAWNAGGCSYTVPKAVLNRLVAQTTESRTNLTAESRTVDQGESRTDGHVSSSQFKTTSTNTTGALAAAKIQTLVSRHELDVKLRISANDLLAAQAESGLSDEDMALSVEHLAFYLGTEDASTIKHPKAYFLSRLRAGFFAPPVDFVSWEERQMAAKVEALRTRAKRLTELRKETFEASYELWFSELTPERKAALTRNTPYANLGDLALRNCLREVFAKESGQEMPSE